MTKLLIFLCLFPMTLHAEPVQVKVSARECYRLVMSEASYVPGISVTGQAVVPADLNAKSSLSTTGQPVVPADLNGNMTATDLPDLMTLTLPISLDLEKNYGFWDSDLDFGSVPLAKIEIRDGQVFVNGRLISANTADALKKACKEQINKENMDKNQLTTVQ